MPAWTDDVSLGALKSQVLENANGRRIKYTCLIVEITMELPLLEEWVSLCLGFRVAQNGTSFVRLNFTKIGFSKLFHCRNHEKICNNTVTKDPTHYTLWNVSVLKATTENKTTSLTTYFTKLTTGNNVFIVSVIVYKVTVTSCRYYINVQCVRLARRAQACDAIIVG